MSRVLPEDLRHTPSTPGVRPLDLLRVVDRYGPWVALAGFLVWWLTTDISGNVKATRDIVINHVVESNFYMRQICLNTAKDDAQRANCFGTERSR